jgi:hypothetical protein
MCWSADVSLKTYILGMGLAILSRFRKDINRPMWIFLVAFIHMQLVEYFLWKNINNPRQLEFWSKIGALLIFIQPLLLMNILKDQDLKMKLMAAYMLVVGGWYLLSRTKFETRVGRNGHLEWDWFPEPSVAWTTAWAIAWFLPVALNGDYKFMVVALAGYIPSLYFYFKYKTMGSMWCWISVFSAAAYLVF